MGLLGLDCSSTCSNANVGDWSTCMCDELCDKFADCCADADALNRTLSSEFLKLFQCIRHGRRGYMKTYAMVAKCPSDWEDNSTRELCETKFSSNDPLTVTPFTNKKTKKTYFNFYCALCNGENDGTEIKAWGSDFDCSGLGDLNNKTLKWNETTFQWEVEFIEKSETKTYQCYQFFAPGDDLINYVRYCHKDILKPSCEEEDETEALCHSYLAPVKIGKLLYRNIHCAMCEKDVGHNVTNVLSGAPTCGPFNKHLFIFYFLRMGTLFHYDLTVFSNKVGFVCNDGEVYYPISKTCRTIFCPKNMTLMNGACVKKTLPIEKGKLRLKGARRNETENDLLLMETESDNSPLPNDSEPRPFGLDCLKFEVAKEHYESQENETIYLLLEKRKLHPGDYEMVNDSVYICATGMDRGEKFDSKFRVFSIFFLGISEGCLIIHMGVGFFTKDFKTILGLNLQSLSISMFVGFLLYLVSSYVEPNTTSCYLISVFIHYCFLSSFWWSSVIAFDVFRGIRQTEKFRSVGKNTCRRFLAYSLWAWIAPALIVALCLTFDNNPTIPVHFQPQYGRDICWIGQKMALVIYFILPLSVILLSNFIFFFWTIYIINSVKNSSTLQNRDRSSNARKEAVLSVKLAVVMGLCWVTGIIAGFFDVSFLWYLFVLLCASQGVFIFFAFTWGSRTVKHWRGRRSSIRSSSGTETRSTKRTTS